MADFIDSVTASLSTSTSTSACRGRIVQIHLSGTWAGTATVSIADDSGTYVTPTDTKATMTANDVIVVENALARNVRVDFTRSSGTLDVEMHGVS